MFPPTQTISCSCRDACLHLMFVCQWAGWSLITEAVSVEQPGTGCILPALINDALSVPCLWCPRPHCPGSTEPTSLVEQTVAAGVCNEHFHPNCWGGPSCSVATLTDLSLLSPSCKPFAIMGLPQPDTSITKSRSCPALPALPCSLPLASHEQYLL